ncbi:laccase-3-like protein [Cinnamomum micranthum f. kanehirae]|uniref:Laccase-3-like protein n=1 Tax=Cinnamomum micranthum f. kanehirae TaxID=337451 RepID=A0A3S3MX79_9MAGN|nr:laccase-3-like protein [Cinnamomum micranthum f. kanehirae]
MAYYKASRGVYTTDFHTHPALAIRLHAANIAVALATSSEEPKVVQDEVWFDSQDQSPNASSWYHFYVLANGFGNFIPRTDTAKFSNLTTHPRGNTIGVLSMDGTAFDLVADNPGAWLMHATLDVSPHLGLVYDSSCLRMEFGELQSLEPPPADLPKC